MKKRIGTLLLVVGATMAVLAPAASADGKKHGGSHARMVCGTVDASSTAASLVVTTAKRGNVTITNTGTPAVDTAAFLGITPASSVCAKVTRVKAADGTKTLALVSIAAFVPKVKPYARVEAQGLATVAADGKSVTVDSVIFTVPTGTTLPADVVSGARVRIRGVIATAMSTTIDLTRVRVKGASAHKHGGHGGHGDDNHADPNNQATSSGDVVRVSGAVTAVSATSLTVANLVTFSVPAGVTLDTTVIVGASVCARGTFDGTVLNLAKVRVKS